MDCSVTKRKGCNYCLRMKDLGNDSFIVGVYDDGKELYVTSHNAKESISIPINYCPICGKEL